MASALASCCGYHRSGWLRSLSVTKSDQDYQYFQGKEYFFIQQHQLTTNDLTQHVGQHLPPRPGLQQVLALLVLANVSYCG